MRRLMPYACLAACAALILCSLPAAYAADTPSAPQSPKAWFDAGKDAIERNKLVKPNTGKAKNVILFVGDGMGIATVTAARILDGQQRGLDGEYHRLSFERLPYSAFSVTASANQQTSDSAPTGTALVTGVKANDGAISVDQTIQREELDAKITEQKSLRTILERAEQKGLATGIVTTARITHATPAVNYAHVSERDWESDSDLPAGATVKDIARQLIDFPYGNGIEVIFGGGRAQFLPNTQTDPEDTAVRGRRKDGRNLIGMWKDKYRNGVYVWNQKDFDAIDPRKTERAMGLFQPSHMRYSADRGLDVGGEPTLAEMTAKAIELLKKNKQGFYLMVEAGRIDHGHHAGNAYRALTDTIALSDAVATAVKLTSDKDTLIVVTADHSHTFNIGGYPSRGNPILGKSAIDGRNLRDVTGQPFTTLSYANGPGVFDGRRREFDAATERVTIVGETNSSRRPSLNDVDTTKPSYMQEAIVPLNSETHGGEDVPIYASGPQAYLFRGALEQHVVYHVMAEALGFKD